MNNNKEKKIKKRIIITLNTKCKIKTERIRGASEKKMTCKIQIKNNNIWYLFAFFIVFKLAAFCSRREFFTSTTIVKKKRKLSTPVEHKMSVK